MFSTLLPLMLLMELMVSGASAAFSSPVFWLGGGMDVDIVEFKSTLLLPTSPQFPTGMEGAVWAGLITEEDDFVQTLFQPSSNDPCHAQPGQWCTYGYAIDCPEAGSHDCGIILAGQHSTIEANAAYDVRYVRDRSTNNITQTVTKDGKVLSLLLRGSGQGKALQFAAECHGCQAVTMPAYSWVDTTIVLDRPEMAFGKPFMAHDVVYGTMSTPDNGRTWRIDWLHMNEAPFPKDTKRNTQIFPSGPYPLPSGEHN